MNSKFYKILFFFVSLLSVILIISFFINPVVSPDSGFYLAVAREIYSGKIYFHDIGINYNPLSIVLLGLPFLFGNNPAYEWHLLINIIIILCSSLVFYKIAKEIYSKCSNCLFYTAFFVLLSLVLDGKYLMLEPLSVFFQLLGLLFYLKFIKDLAFRKIFIVGLCICLAFLSKQYGLFIALPIFINMFVRKGQFLREVLTISLGFLVPILAFFFYLHAYGVDFGLFIKYILGAGFELDEGVGTGIGTSFFSYPIDTLYILLFNSYVFILTIMYVKKFRVFKSKKIFFLTLALTPLSVLYFANYWHYYQYIIPYWLLFYVYVSKEDFTIKYEKSIGLAFAFSACLICFYSVTSFSSTVAQVKKQEREKKEIFTYLSEGTEVYLHGLSPSYYYICNLKSINLEKIAYTFSGYFHPETIVKNLNSGAYIITNEDGYSEYQDLYDDWSIDEIKLSDHTYFLFKKN